MNKDDLWPPQTLAEALTYYAESDWENCINYEVKIRRKAEHDPEFAKRLKQRNLYLARQFKYSFIPDEDVMRVFGITPDEYATL